MSRSITRESKFAFHASAVIPERAVARLSTEISFASITQAVSVPSANFVAADITRSCPGPSVKASGW